MPERRVNQRLQTSVQFYADNLKNLASEHKSPPLCHFIKFCVHLSFGALFFLSVMWKEIKTAFPLPEAADSNTQKALCKCLLWWLQWLPDQALDNCGLTSCLRVHCFPLPP